MVLKGVIFEDFVNYKKPCMTLEFPCCTFKCGNTLCQNSFLANTPNIDIDIDSLIERYCLYLKNSVPTLTYLKEAEPGYRDCLYSQYRKPVKGP